MYVHGNPISNNDPTGNYYNATYGSGVSYSGPGMTTSSSYSGPGTTMGGYNQTVNQFSNPASTSGSNYSTGVQNNVSYQNSSTYEFEGNGYNNSYSVGGNASLNNLDFGGDNQYNAFVSFGRGSILEGLSYQMFAIGEATLNTGMALAVAIAAGAVVIALPAVLLIGSITLYTYGSVYGPRVFSRLRGVFRGGQQLGSGSKTLQLPTPRDSFLNNATNPKLKNAINQLYRPGARTGSGSTADALRYELRTGGLVGGRSHVQKAKGFARNIERIIKRENLNIKDYQIADYILNDLRDALGR